MNQYNFFITCPKGLAPLLHDELAALAVPNLKASEAGVQFQGAITDAYRICLWSRLANRVLLTLGTIDALNAEQLYRGIKKLPWSIHVAPNGSLVVDAHGTNEKLINSQFTAQKVKDAIVDQFQEQFETRPNVDKQDPDLRINVWVRRETAVISIDLSGESLHRRGYRILHGVAPLKENLAAALLYRSQWPTAFTAPTAFIDPLCGSGTLVLEALQIAANIAPGLQRKEFGFQRWLKHDAAAWEKLTQDAAQKRERGLAQTLPQMIGYDTSLDAIDLAKHTAEQLGLEHYVSFQHQEVAQLHNITHCKHGLLLTNPPYGERLNPGEDVAPLYQTLATQARTNFEGWHLGIFTGTPEACARIGIRPKKKYRFFNGTLPCQLLQYSLEADNFYPQ